MRTGPVALRSAAAVLLVAVLMAALLCAYAAPRLGLPWRNAERVLLPGAGFEGGSATPDGRLRVQRAGGAARALVVLLPGTPLEGRFLSYRFHGVAPTLRLALGWRVEGSSDWHWAPVPFPDRRVTLDMERVTPDWTGKASALAFALLPADLLPAQRVPAMEIVFEGAELEGDAYAPALAALLDEWLAYQQWSGRSINTGGFDLRFAAPRPLQGFVLLLVAAVLLVGMAGLLAGRRPPRTGVLVTWTLLGAWLLLDLAQLRLLGQRALHLSSLHQAAQGALSVHPALAAALAEVRGHPRLRSAEARLALLAEEPFLRSWPGFALLPVNAGLVEAAQVPGLPAGTLLLRLGSVGDYRRGSGLLHLAGHAIRVQELQAGPQLQLLVLDGPAGGSP